MGFWQRQLRPDLNTHIYMPQSQGTHMCMPQSQDKCCLPTGGSLTRRHNECYRAPDSTGIDTQHTPSIRKASNAPHTQQPFQVAVPQQLLHRPRGADVDPAWKPPPLTKKNK